MTETDKQMSPVDRWFNAYRVSNNQDAQAEPSKRFYFVESSAPINVDETSDFAQGTSKIRLAKDNTTKILEEIAQALQKEAIDSNKKADLVISVHGFNNPRDTLLHSLFSDSYNAIDDDVISQENSIFISYRWPSERIGAPWNSLLSAAPWTLLAFLLLGPVLLLLSFFYGALLWLGVLLLGISFAAFTLRIIVYYRDQYRATHYGAPDLVELVRDLENRLFKLGLSANQVGLSFVAHSMGGYVVTNAVRILSDLFTPVAIATRGLVDTGGDSENLAKLGRSFSLARLVLVSPDIPAEVLISTRANVLASSLKRFPEAYLFSNEGDEVLRMVSTIANYFSFPTTSRKYGYRLGNTSIIPTDASTAVSDREVNNHIRVGFSTLKTLENGLKTKRDPVDLHFPGQLSYFDCTYFKDGNNPTLTGGGKVSTKPISLLRHVFIFCGYMLGKFDVHGGYFKTPFLRSLIFRLAHLGFERTQNAFMEEEKQDIIQLCEAKQVKVLPKARYTSVKPHSKGV
jgi:pimeloyl-ACP methyl ester carboxylesterase